MIPGGGIEGNETPAECCVREVAEETGLIVQPQKCFLVINEYYEEWKFVSYFYECTVTGSTDRNPTTREIEVGATPKWINFDEAMDIFSHHQDFSETDEERRGIYLREYNALLAFLDWKCSEEGVAS